jgi:preprotein translocase subunit SecG
MQFEEYIYIAQIIVSVVLTLAILFQAKGADVGGIFGGSSGGGSFRTRRGIEKTLFQLTILLAIVFLIMSAWSVRANITS